MAPGREWRFLLDRYPGRAESKLPMVIGGVVRYGGPHPDGKVAYEERFVIDLAMYEGSLLPSKGISDLITAVEKINTEIGKWRSGSGLAVTLADSPRRRDDGSRS